MFDSIVRVLVFLFLIVQSTSVLANEDPEFKSTRSFLDEFSKVVEAGFKTSAVNGSRQSASGPNFYCNITKKAPTWGAWKIIQADLDGPFVVMHYRNDSAPAPLPKSVIFVWKRSGQYAPWIAYHGSDNVELVKVNPLGGIAFVQSSAPGTYPPKLELLYCPQSTFLADLDDVLTAYPCATQPNLAVQVDNVLFNQPFLIFGANAADGDLNGFDWIGDRLVFSRTKLSTTQGTINLWDSVLGTTQTIESYFYSANTQNALTVVSANRFGSVGYRILNLTGMLSGNIFGEYGGAHPTVPGILTQFSTVPFTWNLMHETGADLVSYGTTNFVTMGTEHQLFLRQKPAPATPFTPAVEPGELYALTSEDGYVAKHLVAVAPNPNSILYNPLRVATPTFPDALVASSTFNNATRVEFFLYTAIPGQAGQYLHFETVNPTGIFQNIAVQAVSDDPVNSGVVAVQYSSSTAAGEWVLIECI